MSSKLQLSVIIPFLNASEDVEGLFKVLAAQTGVNHKTIEMLVVNDGSTDDTMELVEQHKHLFRDFADFRTIEHDKRKGLAQTRQDGADAARGTFITFADKRMRYDPDYLAQILGKKHNIVIGNVYMDKALSVWDRLIALIRKKIYFPYFNHPFDDIELDRESYKKFKNKGGGAVMLVKRDYYLRASAKIGKGKNVSDDTLLVENLLAIEPLLKTADAKTLYLNRTGFRENLHHLYERGPKFVDYYTKPGTRFFPAVAALVAILIADIVLAFFVPIILPYELLAALILLILLAVYLSEELLDFITCLWLFPVILVAFVAGILKGLAMKILRLY